MKQTGCAAIMAIVALQIGNTTAAVAEELITGFGRAVAIVRGTDPDTVLVVSRTSGRIAELAVENDGGPGNRMIVRSISEPMAGRDVFICDMVALPRRNAVVMADAAGNRILLSRTGGQPAPCEIVGALSVRPTRLAVSEDETVVGITSESDQAVCFGILAADDTAIRVAPPVRLSFRPGRLLALTTAGLFLVADAYGGNLALIRMRADSTEPDLIAHGEVSGHHIGGMTVSEDRLHVFLSHQILSHNARTTRDDIHWGSLIRNVVTALPLDSVMHSTGTLSTAGRTVDVGDTGNGAADPADIAAWDDGFVLVSTGSNRLWWTDSYNTPAQDIPVGSAPRGLVRLDDHRIVVLSQSAGTVSLVDVASAEVSSVRLDGPSAKSLAASERGERLFFSGELSHDRWMSCSSCHVNGRTPDLLSDTLGDGSFGTPKRIPTLMGTSDTGPWGWLGNKPNLEDQIRQTLRTTMHGSISDEQTVSDLAAYLRTLRPEPAADMSHHPGSRVFERRGCIECHALPALTIHGVRDVGVSDEAGNRRFNPPSLRGVGRRRRLFHDGRFNSLEQLVVEHPERPTDVDDQQPVLQHAESALTAADAAALVDFLRTL